MVTSYERDAIRPHVLGKFRELLLATAQSPAMLFYLDNWQSAGPDVNKRRRQGLNENYGRELMELHTLGVDGATASRTSPKWRAVSLAGLSKNPISAAASNSTRNCMTKAKSTSSAHKFAGGGMNDYLKVLDILAHHPSTAHFISKKPGYPLSWRTIRRSLSY